MAAVLATALSLGSAIAARSDLSSTASARPRRLARRWIVDSVTGGLTCVWAADEEPRLRPVFHLMLVRS